MEQTAEVTTTPSLQLNHVDRKLGTELQFDRLGTATTQTKIECKLQPGMGSMSVCTMKSPAHTMLLSDAVYTRNERK